MADRKKVIKGLECCSVMGDRKPSWNNIKARNCGKCPYNKPGIACTRALAYAALELLKAQEQKRGRWTTERTSDHDGEWYCSSCGYEPIVMTDDMKFCPGCGAKMTMEGKENAPE